MENNGPYPPAGEPGQPANNPQPGWAPEWASPGAQHEQGPAYPGGPYPGSGMPPAGPATPPPFAQPGYPQPGYGQPQQPGYGQPQQPGWPQGGQPGFGGPGAPPPPKKSNTGLIIGGLVGGGVLIVVIIVVVLIVIGSVATDPKTEAVKKLGTAATKLSSAPGLKYHGTVASTSDTLDGDFKVTSGGRTSASANWGGSKVDLLSLDDKLYVKGDTSFWSSAASYTPKWNYIDGNRWGKLASYNFSFDFKRNLSPSSLAQKLRQVSKYSITSQSKTTVGGTSATKVVTYGTTYYVANDDSRLVRIESTSYPRYAVDVSQLSDTESTADLRTGVSALKDSFDSSRNASIEKVRFGTCNTSACTIFTKVWSTGVSTSPVPVNVFTTISSEKGKAGTHYGDCSTTGTVTSYTAIEVSCTVSGGDWPKARGGGGSWAHSDAFTSGASSTEIQTMLDGISRD